MIALGTTRPASFTSPAIHSACCHPPYEKSVGMTAAKRAARNAPVAAGGGGAGAGSGGAGQKTAMASTVSSVASLRSTVRFWIVEPDLTPATLAIASPQMKAWAIIAPAAPPALSLETAIRRL